MRFPTVVAVLAVVLAGCSGPPGLEDRGPADRPGDGSGRDGGGAGSDDDGGGFQPPADQPERVAMLLSFGLEDCTGLESFVSLDADAAQALLPDGYAVATSDGASGPVATARYVWASCGGLRTPTAFVNDTVFGSVSLQIEAPESAADAEEHWYRFRVMAQDDLLLSLWVAAGYDVALGEYQDESSLSGSPLGGANVEDRSVRLAGYGGQGLAAVPGGPTSVRTAQYTETLGGRLEWIGEFQATSYRELQGTLEVPPDDPLADVPLAPGSPSEVLRQRYLDEAHWSATDLWFRGS